jgi:copper(I)-binding protein
MMQRSVASALLVLLVACGEPAGPPVVASNIVVTAPAPDMPMAAAYLDISNHSGAPIRITRVTSPEYESVEMHDTVIEDDVARMRAIPALEIADGETVSFERGGRHLMLMRPPEPPVTVTLYFYSEDLLLLSVSTEFTSMTD